MRSSTSLLLLAGIASAALSACTEPTQPRQHSFEVSVDSASYAAGSVVTITARNVGSEPASPWSCPFGGFDVKAAGVWFAIGPDLAAFDCLDLVRGVAPGAAATFRAPIPASASSGVYRYNFDETGVVTGEFVIRGS